LQKVIYKPGSGFSIAIAITIAIETVPEKSMIDFHSGIDQRFPDQNRIAFFVLKSIRD